MKFPTLFNRLNTDPISDTTEPSMTDQDKKQECDLNYIIENYVRTGKDLPVNSASYGDLTRLNVKDYQDAMMLTAECKTEFELLPAKMREEFGNVAGYVDYISNPKNLKDCCDRGLVDKTTLPSDVLDVLYPQTVKPNIDIQQPNNDVVTTQPVVSGEEKQLSQ